jgi:hypothetical protein
MIYDPDSSNRTHEETEPMIPTTHHLGQRPGRARLGAYGRGSQVSTGTGCTRAWRGVAGRTSNIDAMGDVPANPVFAATPIETLAPTGTAHATGPNSMKRTAQLLGTRST